jgi:hypothetical protein
MQPVKYSRPGPIVAQDARASAYAGRAVRVDLPAGGATAFVVRGAVPAALRQAAEARVDVVGFSPTGTAYPAGYRDNDRAVVDDAALADQLFAALQPYLPADLVDGDGGRWRLAGLNPRFRFCRYRDGQSFAIHRDGAWDDGQGCRSHLTVQVYLNDADEFAGGDTRFFAHRGAPTPTFVVRPAAGLAIVFDHRLWHDGAPVTAGEKRVLRTDVLYRRVDEGPVDEVHDDALGGGVLVEEVHDAHGHRGYVWALAATPAGALFSGARDRTVKRWQRAGGGWRCVATLDGHGSSVAALAVTPGRLWTGERAGVLRAWTLEGTPVLRLPLVDDRDPRAPVAVTSLVGAADDGVVVGAADGVVRWLSSTGAVRRAVVAHAGWVWGLAATVRALWSVGADGRLRRHHGPPAAPPGEHDQPRTADGAGDVVLAHDRPLCAVAARVVDAGDLVVVGDEDGGVTVVVAGAAGGAGVVVARAVAHAGAVRAVAVVDDVTVVTAGEDDVARVWHVDGDHLRPGRSVAHGDFVRALAVLPDGAVASAGYDGRVRVWRPGGPRPDGRCGAHPDVRPFPHDAP